MNKHAQALGRLGGKSTSKAKTVAARKNAKLGGWPKGRKRKSHFSHTFPPSQQSIRGKGRKANAALIVRACNEYETLVEELAIAKSQIENHGATLAQVRLNERHNAQRLADTLKDSLANRCDWRIAAREALAQWEVDKQ